ncbi:MAG: tetratricopeptide repeat protein [Azospirillaceae bacterium]|nr:tetratricopeptide repeat protein [Azospirillaceae bacterium]
MVPIALPATEMFAVMDKAMDERWRKVMWRQLVLAGAVLVGSVGATVADDLGTAQTAAAPGATPAANTLPLTGVGSYLAARFAEHAEDPVAALQFLTRALADSPTDPSLLGTQFALLLDDGRTDEALALADRVTGTGPEQMVAVVLLAAADVAAGRDDAAVARLTALPRDGLGQHLVPLMLAWAQAAGKHNTEAQAALEQVGTEPGFVVLRALHSGMIAEVAGDRAAADQAYQSALRPEPSLRVVEAVAAYDRRTGRTELARQVYDSFGADHDRGLLAMDLDASPPPPPPPPLTARQGMAFALYDIASALSQEEVPGLAMLYARVGLFLSPDLDLCQLLVGDILAARGRDDEALAAYRKVGGDAGTRHNGIAWLAVLRQVDELKRLDRLPDAIELLRTLVAQRPERTDSMLELGETYRDANRYDEAIATFQKAITQAAKTGSTPWTLFYARGLTYDKMGDWARAEPDLVKAAELNPEQPFLLNYLGYSWVDRGIKLDQARKLIERAVALRPDDGFIIDSLGWALYRQGDFNGALGQLEKAVQLKPLDPTLNEHLGDVYWQLGRHREARYQWQRALKESDDKKQIGVLQTKLDQGLPKRQTAGTLN